MTRIKITVACHLNLWRKSLVHLLEKDQHLEIVSEAADRKELVENLKKIHADMVLLHCDENVLGSFGTVDILRNRFPKLKILINGMAEGSHAIQELFSKGVHSVISRESGPEQLFKAIHTVDREGFYFDETVSASLIQNNYRTKAPAEDSALHFKQRELDVMHGICEGLSNREIADLLNISCSTVDFYRTSLYQKTDCHNIASLMKYAIRRGIVSLT